MPAEKKPIALYRFYDRSGRLLYIGQTVRIGQRLADHSTQREWWSQVDHIQIEPFQDPAEARAAELMAIRNEHPLHNRLGLPLKEDRKSQLALARELAKMKSANSPYLTATQAAERLGIHPSLVRAYLRDGRLKAVRQNPWLISERELERFARLIRPRGRPSQRP